LAVLATFRKDAKRRGDLDEWRRAKVVLGYVEGQRVVELAGQVDVTRGSVNRWLQWYEADGVDGLRTKKAPGAARKLSKEQEAELVDLIRGSPLAAGFSTGLWTGPMVGEVIRDRFGVSYHNHHVPRLLHRLGFSVQRPRKRLARADADKQGVWLSERLPAIKKKQRPVGES
jgi:transposase